MADWEEVKRLAADFQRAQLSITAQKLSERNCIEIVTKLVQLKLIDVVFTSDGKEYITPQHVQKEIKDEVYSYGGRANLVDLAQVLNLDLNIVEQKAAELVQKEKEYTLVLGELIERDYLDRIAEEINEKLQQAGQMTISDLTKQYGLPSDFMQELVDRRLGKTIQGQADPHDRRIIFTQAFIARQKSKIRGALCAVTRPTQILNIINHYSFQENIFYTVLDDLVHSEDVAGDITGGRQDRAVFVPDIYSKSQTSWVDSFYKQNGYLEYDNLVRIGIPDPQSFIRRHFKQEPITYLATCAVGKLLLEQIEVAVDEALLTHTWIDIMPMLPSVCSRGDGQQLLQVVMKARSKTGVQPHIFCDTIVMSDKMLQDLTRSFDPLMTKKAEKDSLRGVNYFTSQAGKVGGETGAEKKERKDERRKKASAGKGGGGHQGRETKTKAVKKKYKAGRGGGSDESGSEDEGAAKNKGKAQDLPFMSVEEIEVELGKAEGLNECPEELLTEVAEQLHRPLSKAYQQVALNVFLSSSSNSGTSRRKQHADIQEKVNGLIQNLRLFEKGLKPFTDDVQTQLSKYLLKTLATEIVNLVFGYLAHEHLMAAGEDTVLTHELRLKLITKLPENTKEHLTKLNTSLNGKSIEDFITSLEAVMTPDMCDMVVRKSDKKKDRQTMFSHRQTLQEQLGSTQDPALALHIAVLLLYQLNTHNMLHASGKFVPQIIVQLEGSLPAELFSLLQQFQGLVIKQFASSNDEEQLGSIKLELETLLPKMKEAVVTYRKTSQSEDA